MAPDLALLRIEELSKDAIVVDPMAGSGTVLYQSSASGRVAYGFDLDPLAILISKVVTAKINIDNFFKLADYVDSKVKSIADNNEIYLPWIDQNDETIKFIEYWFAMPQRKALRKLAWVLNGDEEIKKSPKYRNALMLAMSRIIITKENRASLARDTSRSRPHKVTYVNSFDVMSEFMKSVKRMAKIMERRDLLGKVTVRRGDARNIPSSYENLADAIITSPPYLNAIDYIRGHKMSLVWMGYSIPTLRKIRALGVGAEKKIDKISAENQKIVNQIVSHMGDVPRLPSQYIGMVGRYALDLYLVLKQATRILKNNGKATYVVGDSCLRGIFVKNSKAVICAAKINGLKLIGQNRRELPSANRSLPMFFPKNENNPLYKRMKYESVITFLK